MIGYLKRLLSSALLSVILCYSNTGMAEPNRELLQEFMNNLDSLSTPFRQTLLNQYGETLDESGGMLHVQRPGMFHWAYTKPYEQYIISDGKSLWIYDADLEQVTIRDVASIIEDSPAAILGGDIDIDEHYLLSDGPASSELHWLELTPRDSESQYSAIRLAFENENLKKMILFDALGQTTQIEFDLVVRNSEPGHELFQFTPPEGIDVIDSRE
ncbi:MAG: outer membrane lipoprotein chaperone LolA [Gammaproteobacteria bacterium]|nr:outer membrane lipoprotein chaperone LolA [Gammaproteobacteria bacterium]